MVIEACRAMLTERFRLMCKQRGRQQLALSQYRDDAVRSAGGEQLLGARLQVQVVQHDAWKDWLIRVRNRPELAKQTCKLCMEATAGLAWEDDREGD